MATSNKVFVSPGVYTSERDLSFVAQSVGITTLGIVGETQSGPAFEPMFITNFDEFTSYFGGTSPAKFVNTQIPKYETSYIAKSYLQQSNQLFVTRVLGLSGYDAGPSWSITTVGNLDKSTVSISSTPTGSYTLYFSGITGSSESIELRTDVDNDINDFNNFIDGKLYSAYTTNTTDTSTVEEDLKNIFSTIINDSSLLAGNAFRNNAYMFGVIDGTTDSMINSINGFNYTDKISVLGTTTDLTSSADLESYTNDAWYYLLFEYDNNTSNYLGESFALRFTTISHLGSGEYQGQCEVYGVNYSGTPIDEYHDVVVATLRSRGIATYGGDDGAVYEVSGTTDVTIDCTGDYELVKNNPFSTFGISGLTKDGDTFNFKTSFDISKTNYITKVFGQANFSKDRNEVPLFVEENYYNLLNTGYNEGKIRGLNCDLLSLEGARTDNDNTGIGWYLDKYQTPETPYVVSELRGNNVYDLFKFVLISDGNSANREVKISIANISFNNLTFDVVVRDFYDTDANAVVLEKFTNCSMDISQNNYVGKKIGTSNGDFELKSRYVMLELNEDAPADALPCGFKGFKTRQYSGYKSPKLLFKTKYYSPGETVANPPFGSANGDNLSISSGDKVRKTFLGVSDTVGIDADFLSYKGKQNPTNLDSALESDFWSTVTKGFHMDSGATSVLDSSGETLFEVGSAEFRSEPSDDTHTYYKLNSRKFTLVAQGGFDGWDIYREHRTNGDRYTLGNSGFLKGAATSITFPNATGWGAFKEIVGPDKQRWANTDYYAYLWGQWTFSNPEAVNINVFTTPGIDYVNNSNLVEDAIEMIETDRADSVYICTTPDYQMFTNSTGSFDLDFIRPDEVVDNLEETGIDSNYTATYYPWILTRDGVNNTQIYLPPTAEVVRNLALTDNIAFPWFASAGYTRGLVNGIKARKKLTQEDRDILYKGRVNPIATFSDVGTVIWGNKTLQVRQSALDRINVRRLLLQARKLISAVAVRLLFEQNDDQVRQEFLDSVNPILDSIRRDRGLIDFRVVVQNTPEDLDANQLVGKIYLKPTRALEFIDIEFLITPTGASFEDI